MTTATTHRTALTAFLAVLWAVPAAASTIHYNSLQAGPSAGWEVTPGRWSWTDQGLTDSAGESRIFLDALDGASKCKLTLPASLLKGQGWGVFFGANLDGRVVPCYGEPLNPSGDLWGLRTWGNSKAVFRDYAVGPRASSVPDPCTLALLATGSAVFLRRRRPG